MGKVTGVNRHKARMLSLTSGDGIDLITQALGVGADAIAKEAQVSITAGAVSGKNHVASLPGEPPNNDTGVLANNIESEIVGPLHARVSSNAPYAAALELGSPSNNPLPRPYMSPAAQRERPKVVELVVKAVNKALRSTPTNGR